MTAKLASDPLKQIWDFIEKNFKAMPKFVRVFVYLLFVAYFIGSSVRVFWPEVWEMALDEEQEIRGEIQGSDEPYLPLSAWLTEINGDKLYVKKKKIADDRFYFEWILKVTPKELNTKVHFYVAEFYQDPANPEIKGSRYLFRTEFIPSKLQRATDENRIVLKLDLDRRALAASTPVNAVSSPEQSDGNFLAMIVPRVFAQSKSPIKVLARDSAAVLLRDFRKSSDPISDRNVRFLLPAAGAPIKIAVAESLKKALARGNKGATADYAAVLTEYDSLFMLTSAGSSSAIFDDRFYRSAVTLLHTGSDYESRRMAWFLYKLQDSRSLQHLFREYTATTSVRAKRHCLYILESFSTNGDPKVRSRVKEWLIATQRGEKSRELGQALAESLKKF